MMTNVERGLFWCGWHEVRDIESFDIVVDTIGECKEHPVRHVQLAHQTLVTWTFPDSPVESPSPVRLRSLGEYLRQSVYGDNAKVLVFCAAGWNRSALVVAQILHLQYPYLCGGTIVDKCRQLRSGHGNPGHGAFNNANFRAIVLGWK